MSLKGKRRTAVKMMTRMDRKLHRSPFQTAAWDKRRVSKKIKVVKRQAASRG